MNNCDIVLITVPVFDFKLPNPSIHHLKGFLNLNGFSSRCFDLTQECARYFGKKYSLLNKCLLEHYYEITDYDEEIKFFYKDFINIRVKSLNPEWIGINVHSVYNYKSTSFLTNIIRDIMPNVKIIIGGDGFHDKTVDKNIFNENIKYDFFVIGDGEESLVELLKTGKQLKIERNDTTNLNSLPFPDYSDYYKDFKNLDKVAITGSKGCSNNCNFCSIKYYHKIFRQRSALSIYTEMLHQCKLYNTKHFQFSDSIINGDMKVFRELLSLIVKLQEQYTVNYSGYFGINNNLIENDFKMMKKSNILNPWIGVESVSENVRKSMNKRYSNKSLYFTIDNLIKYDIKPALLFLVGYPTETEEDFQKTIDFLEYYKNHSSKIIVRFGETYHIRKETPTEKMNIYEWEYNDSMVFWKSTIVPNLDFPERVKRRKLLGRVAKDLGYNFTRDEFESLQYLNKKLDYYNVMESKNGNSG